MSDTSITVEEWLAELNRLAAGSSDNGALTTREIAQRTGRSEPWVRRMLRAAIGAGRVESCKKMIVQISGIPRLTEAYRLVRQEQPKAAKKR